MCFANPPIGACRASMLPEFALAVLAQAMVSKGAASCGAAAKAGAARRVQAATRDDVTFRIGGDIYLSLTSINVTILTSD